jgi:hypothetical protein
MKAAKRLTAIVEREDDGYISFCPELDIASEEALALFFETASPSEIARRTHNEVFVTQIEVQVG